MTYDFDKRIERAGTNALALEGYQDYLFGGSGPVIQSDDIISMWVADMQFASAPAAIRGIMERLKHPVLGYTMNFDDTLYDAFSDWCITRYGWHIERKEMETSLGVIPALFDLVDCICKPDGKVLTLTPAYGYFNHAAAHYGRELVTSKLTVENGIHQIDFVDFELKARDPSVQIFFFCHPHNPTGRLWNENELQRIGQICLDNEVFIVSGEIHCDLLRVGMRHTPLASLFPNETRVVTCMAPSKTFNLAGLMTAITIIPDEALRMIWRKRHYPFMCPLGLAAATAAYKDGSDWLEALRTYLDGNFYLVEKFLKQRLPLAAFRIPEATYLAWIDLSKYFQTTTNLTKLFLEKGGVIVEGGEMFVENGEAYVRLNLAIPRAELERALGRICDATLSARDGF